MTSRLSALLVWGLAAASAVFWALRLFGSPLPVPPQAQVAVAGNVLSGDLSRLLGTAPVAAPATVVAAPDAAARLRLTGVVATRSARVASGPAAPGWALIAVDGKPARAYRVGDAIDAGLVLHSVGLRSARLSRPDGGGEFVLELPPPAAAATGVPGGAVVPVAGAVLPGAVPALAPTSPAAPSLPPGSLPSADVAPEGLPEDARRRVMSR